MMIMMTLVIKILIETSYYFQALPTHASGGLVVGDDDDDNSD